MAKKKNEDIKKEPSRSIPARNYVVALFIIVAVIALTFYVFQWIKVLNKEKLATSYLVSSNTIIYEVKNIDEINAVFSEMPSEYFVYISYNNDKEIYNFEKDLKELIDAYGLKDYFYYINVTDMKKKENYLELISEALNLEQGTIKKIPTIIMFREGQIDVDGIVIREDEAMINAADFEKLLEIKEIKKLSR